METKIKKIDEQIKKLEDLKNSYDEQINKIAVNKKTVENKIKKLASQKYLMQEKMNQMKAMALIEKIFGKNYGQKIEELEKANEIKILADGQSVQ